jgi:acyl carrier protein
VSADEIRNRLAKVFAQVLGYAGDLRGDLKPGDIEGWDSVAHVSLVLASEREFKIKFKGADIANMASVADLIERVSAKLS